jgi:integrase
LYLIFCAFSASLNVSLSNLSDSEEITLRAIIQRDCAEHLPEFEIGLHTGMRRSEQYGLAWEFIDFRNRVITIPNSKHRQGRHVTMNSRVTAILSALSTCSIDTGFVFD